MSHGTDLYLHGRVRRVIDGDTVEAELPVYGAEVVIRKTLRLYGLDAPETRGASRAAGLAAKARLAALVKAHDGVLFIHVLPRAEKYGRDLAVLYPDENDEARGFPASLNQRLIEEGHAVPYRP